MGRASWGTSAASTVLPLAAGQGQAKTTFEMIYLDCASGFRSCGSHRNKEARDNGQKEWAAA